jgi:cell fate regulator YaaT (PSP1 superfamily)
MIGRALVRYGTISEVANFEIPSDFVRNRGDRVVVRTHRGIELGTLLTDKGNVSEPSTAGSGQHTTGGDPGDPDLSQQSILRTATVEDEQAAVRLRSECEQDFGDWRERIEKWNLCLELIDLEWMLDKSKLILYVLNDRGPESTKLALQAAAAGYGIVEVQTVGPDGPIVQSTGGGCGSGHCGSGDSQGCCG